MGKLVVTEFVSVDGVFEDPGGSEDYEHGAWTFEYDRGDDGNKFKLDELMEAEVHLLGRVTYEGFAAAWPSREGDFADRLNNAKKVVEVDLKEKGTPLHAATVVGDTVGDPFKDTTSVALNPIIKFSTLFGLLAVEIVIQIKEKAHATAGVIDYTPYVGAVMLAVALVFVWRSFYAMRIPKV